jgi:hypothetical protein
MNEKGEYLDVFSSLEQEAQALRDPVMDRAIDAARAANEMAQILPLGKRERAELVGDLDANWTKWYGEPVLATGKVAYEVTNEDGQKEMREALLWQSRVISDGFNIRRTSVDDEQGKYLGEVVHQFIVPVGSIPDQFMGESTVIAVGSLEDVTLDSTFATKQRAYSWLNTMHPDFIKDVDTRIIASMSEAEAILALSTLDLDRLDLSDELARNCVEAYLKSQIIVDKKVPYGIVIDGVVGHYNERVGQEITYPVSDMRVIASLSSVKLLPERFKNSSVAWRLGLQIKTHPHDRRDVVREYQVPLSSVKEIVSLRDSFYSN